MKRSHDSRPDDLAGPPPGPREHTFEPATTDPGARAIEEMYAEHWRYVLALLLRWGIPAQDAEDVAQAVWMNLHRRRDSYDAQTYKTPRAWITGFVVRCAANHRRTQRRHALVLMEDPGGLVAAAGLNPEQAALLDDLQQLLPNEDQRVALLLQVQHGLTVAEIAAVQEATESAVEGRLRMARRKVKSSDKKRRGAYLGYGSLEALVEALKPKPIPDEVGRRQWERIAERIRQEEGSPSAPEAEPPPSEPPPSSHPPAVALPALPSPAIPAVVALGQAKLVAVLFFVLVIGAGAGVGNTLPWQAHPTGRHDRPTPTMNAAPPATTPRATGSTAAKVTPPSTPTHSTAPSWPAVTVTTNAELSGAVQNEEASRRILSRMRHSMNARRFSMLLSLAEQHARRFGATHVREREALRSEALRETGRAAGAEDRARTLIGAHTEHRRAMERAAGQASIGWTP